VPLGIVLEPLQTIKEAKELVSWSVPSELAIHGFRFAESVLLHRQCGFQINLRRFHRLMPEPQGDDRAIYAPLQQVEGHGVPSM